MSPYGFPSSHIVSTIIGHIERLVLRYLLPHRRPPGTESYLVLRPPSQLVRSVLAAAGGLSLIGRHAVFHPSFSYDKTRLDSCAFH